MLARLEGSGGFPAHGSTGMAIASASDARSAPPRGRVRPRRPAASGSRLREARPQALGLSLEQRLDLREAGQPMAAEAPEPDAAARRRADRVTRPAGEEDLPPVGRRAHPGRGMDG